MDRDALASCSVENLTDTVGQLHGIACAAHRHLLTVVAELDRREAFRDDGAADMPSWLTARLSISFRTARAWVEAARALESLPAIATAYTEGKLSWDGVRAAAEVATPETDAELADLAVGHSAAQLQAMARRHRRVSTEEAEDNHARRSLVWWWGDDHSFMRLSGRLPADQGAILETALARVIDEIPPNPGGVYEDYRSRAADALVELASQRLDADFDADRATVVAHIDVAVLTGEDGAAELESGAGLAAETARRLVCDSRLQAALHASDGTPLGVGRASRTVPHWLARQVRHRDHACRFPGCTRTRFTQNHHIDFWVAHEGPTDLNNLVLLCWHHHRLVHEGGWRVRGDPAGHLEFLRPDGRVLQTGPPGLRPEVRRRLFDEPDRDDGEDDGGWREARAS
jgi:Domain of unknown function (DUF222)/HNH endonuclease